MDEVFIRMNPDAIPEKRLVMPAHQGIESGLVAVAHSVPEQEILGLCRVSHGQSISKAVYRRWRPAGRSESAKALFVDDQRFNRNPHLRAYT